MEQHNNTIENIIKGSMEGLEITPSNKLLSKLRWNLFVSDFFSLQFRKFNIGYFLIAVSGFIGASVILSNKPNDVIKESSSVSVQKSIQPTSDKVPENTTKTLYAEKENSSESKSSNNSSLKAFFELNSESGCAPFTVKFVNKSHNAISYEWSFGNNVISTESSPTYTFNEPGKYNIELVAKEENGKTSTFTRTVNVYGKPEAGFKIDIEASDNTNRKIKFANASEGADSYNWSFGDNTTSKEMDPEHVYANNATYQVSLIATSKHGCTDTSYFVNRFVEKNYALVFPEVFKPNLTVRNNGFYERPENRAFVFFPENNGADNYSLTITGPSGLELFKSNDINMGWNGYFKGRIAPQGSYKYTATGTYPNGQKFTVSGKVELVIDKEFDEFYAQ